MIHLGQKVNIFGYNCFILLGSDGYYLYFEKNHANIVRKIDTIVSILFNISVPSQKHLTSIAYALHALAEKFHLKSGGCGYFPEFFELEDLEKFISILTMQNRINIV